MKIFISDLHLGDGSKADDFHYDAELIKLILKYRGNRIVLLGDIFELWQARLDKILWAHAELYKVLMDNVTYGVFGNHDYLPFNRLWDETYEDDRIFAQHGHQRDKYNKYDNPMRALKWPIGRYITVLVGGLERLFHKDADIYLSLLEKKYGKFLVQAAVLQNKKNGSRGYPPEYSHKKITIEGHSHEPRLEKQVHAWLPTEKIYANCGSWVDFFGKNTPTYIQVNDETIQLRNGLDFSVIKEVLI